MKSRFWFVAALLTCAVILVSFAPAQNVPTVMPTMHMQIAPAVERTPQQMDAFDATSPAATTTRQAPFRPTMDAAQYAQLKAAATNAPYSAKPGVSAPAPLASVATKFVGATECDGPGGCWVPPDVAGSIGKSQFVSVSNNVFEVRSRGGALLKVNSLNGLFGYSAQPMFDPRVQYDEEWQRWVITAPAFQQSSTSQIFGIAVSKTNSATGAYWIYLVDVGFLGGSGGLYDYPMLGLSQDSALFTANIFGASSFLGSSLFSVAKARIYNGFGFSVPVFTGLIATLEPSHQLVSDQNRCAWLAAAPGNSGQVWTYALCNPASSNQSLVGAMQVSGVATYQVPPAAPQPASCAPSGAKLDTLDNRFQNAGTQSGDLLYQTHAVGFGGSFPFVRYYVIKGLLSFAPSISLQNNTFATASSFDFNPSIVADDSGRFGINWSVTDTATNASVHFADNNGSNPIGGSGINVFTSASCYTGVGTNRWGDYSQTSYDPGTGTVSNTNTHIFWIDNETVPSANFWSTEVAKMNY